MTFEELLRLELPSPIASPLIDSLEEERTHCLVLDPQRADIASFLSSYPHLEKHPFVPNAFYFSKDEDFGKSFLYDVGAYSIQDASAMMVPFLLQPKPGETLLDLCAAPGGKSILASFLMENEGCILANDLSFPRAKILSSAVERTGRRNVIVSSNDFSDGFPELHGRFDKIILDAPCSGNAMFRKNEQARKEWSLAKAEKFAKTQRELLEIAASMLKEGGVMVYSTCSFCQVENERAILSFLSAHEEFRPIAAPFDSPSFYHSPLLKEGIHLFPHLFRGEGQYLILLSKAGESSSTRLETPKGDAKLDAYCASFRLPPASYRKEKDGVYRLPAPLRLERLHLLRPGLKIASSLDPFLPDFAFARALDPSFAHPLQEEQARKYLRGETFPLEAKEGWAAVSYKGYVLGYVKVVHGVAKNHYPKGLRHDYRAF